MGKRADFGPDWSAFVANWCSGVAPAISSDAGWRALGVLERLWPDYLDAVLEKGASGYGIVVPMIDLGVTLEACEQLVGFGKILARMKQGERSARSEAAFAAALVRLGHSPLFEPELKGKNLDALISVGGEKIYLEVTAPEQCDEIKAAYSEMSNLSEIIMEKYKGMDVSVYLLTDPDTGIADTILSYLKGLTPSPEDTHEISNVALIKYGPRTAKALSIEHEQSETELPRLFIVRFSRTDDGTSTRVEVGISITDERAQRLMIAEAGHFSRGETNILAMDVSGVPDGIKGWSPLIQRRFQPDINRRFSAVVLFSRFIKSTRVSWRCSVLQNPHAIKKLPKSLSSDLAKLDEASVWQ